MTMVTIRISRLEGADPKIALPDYATEGAAGADLRANLAPEDRREGLKLAPGKRKLVPTGLSLEIPDGYEAQLRPRSGAALRHGVTLANAPGTIDSDYRGPLLALLVNLGEEEFVVRHGERVAQLVVAPVARAHFAEAERLEATERGTGGFGSTGLG